MRRAYIFLTILFLFSVNDSLRASSFEDAYRFYTEGERAESFMERSESFNSALHEYLKMVSISTAPSARLYYNIGNCYFQLSEYGWATYYYYKASALEPYNEKIKENLSMAAEKAGVVVSLVKEYLASLEYEYALVVLIIAFFVVASLVIWLVGKILRLCTYIVGIAVLVGIALYFYYSFFAPLDAVLVRPSILHKDAGAHYAPVKKEPVFLGERVQVVEMHGKWVKIVTPDGTVGYAPCEVVKML